MKEKIVSTQLSPRYGFAQTVRFNQTLRLGDNKLRISIKDDHYEFQSSARIELWNGEKWNLVHSILGPEMQTVAAYQNEFGEHSFAQDRQELIRVAKEIL